jgi:hypothetical protein
LSASKVAAALRSPAASIAQNRTKAISMLTPGPARITAMRFQGDWA